MGTDECATPGGQAKACTTNTGYEVSVEDHDQGFKDVPVEFRKGGETTVRVVALSHRKGAELIGRFWIEKDPYPVLYASLPMCLSTPPDGISPTASLDRLTPFSVDRLLGVAWALAFGDEFQKKMVAAGTTALRTMMGITPGAPS